MMKRMLVVLMLAGVIGIGSALLAAPATAQDPIEGSCQCGQCQSSYCDALQGGTCRFAGTSCYVNDCSPCS